METDLELYLKLFRKICTSFMKIDDSYNSLIKPYEKITLRTNEGSYIRF